MNHRQRYQLALEAAAASTAYRNYQEVRDWVLGMLEDTQSQSDLPSDFWQQEVAGFDYILDASPLLVAKMREHSYHLTGLRSTEYRDHHRAQMSAFKNKFKALQLLDQSGLFVAEAPDLGGFGHDLQGNLLNVDTLKFYECLIALDMQGVLNQFRSVSDCRKVVIEIGAGWGGFGYQFKTLFPDVSYVIVDLPQTLLFSAVYLRALFPEASVFMYGDEPLSTLRNDARSYDFVFLPHFAMKELDIERPDLAVNICSFQEMTTEQVSGYASKLHQIECQTIYSLNRDRAPYNDQLSTVTSALSRHYELRNVNVLSVSYNQVSIPRPETEPRNLLTHYIRHPRRTLRKLKRLVLPNKGNDLSESPRHYRHIVGNRRSDIEQQPPRESVSASQFT